MPVLQKHYKLVILTSLFIGIFFFIAYKTQKNRIVSQNNSQKVRLALLSPALVDIFIELGLKNKIACYAGPIPTKQKLFIPNAKKLGFYHAPILEKIISCKPTLVITSYNGTPPQIFHKLKNIGIKVILYKAQKIKDIIDFTEIMAKKFNAKIPNKLIKLKKMCLSQNISKKQKGRIIISTAPIFITGKDTFVSDAIKCAGFQNIEKGSYKRVSLETLLSDNLEKLLILPKKNILKTESLKKIMSLKNIIIFKTDKLFQASFNILDGILDLKKTLKKTEKKS